MKSLNLNFSSHKQANMRKITALIVAGLMLILVSLLFKHHDITKKIDDLAASQPNVNLAVSKQPAFSEDEIKAQTMATNTLRQLNIPWHALLTTLEQVQTQHPQIKLTSVQPNPIKNDIILSGEANNVAAMMAYVETLKQQHSLQEATLMNQSVIEGETQKTLAFTLHAEWKF